MGKKQYQSPQARLWRLEFQDIVTASGYETDSKGNNYTWQGFDGNWLF